MARARRWAGAECEGRTVGKNGWGYGMGWGV